MYKEFLKNANIIIEKDAFSEFNIFLLNQKYSKIFILTDTNTNNFCLPILLQNLDAEIPFEIIEIDPGEEQKNIEICIQLWDLLLNYEADRNSLLINLGGGVINDLGGFVASTYKRGIDFINIPTTLLAMVDASIGGKNGIDFGNIKNQIGTISNPKMIVIYPEFLETLSQDELLSGFAEMLKHGLIFDKNHWLELKNITQVHSTFLEKFIENSILIKLQITNEDPNEKNIRKLLNFGHTIGHAIESLYLENDNKITHGHAVAIGMLVESHLSLMLNILSNIEFLEIKKTILNHFKAIEFSSNEVKKMTEFIKFDKKNSNGMIRFALIDKIGNGITDVSIDNKLIINAFESLKKN